VDKSGRRGLKTEAGDVADGRRKKGVLLEASQKRLVKRSLRVGEKGKARGK